MRPPTETGRPNGTAAAAQWWLGHCSAVRGGGSATAVVQQCSARLVTRSPASAVPLVVSLHGARSLSSSNRFRFRLRRGPRRRAKCTEKHSERTQRTDTVHSETRAKEDTREERTTGRRTNARTSNGRRTEGGRQWARTGSAASGGTRGGSDSDGDANDQRAAQRTVASYAGQFAHSFAHAMCRGDAAAVNQPSPPSRHCARRQPQRKPNQAKQSPSIRDSVTVAVTIVASPCGSRTAAAAATAAAACSPAAPLRLRTRGRTCRTRDCCNSHPDRLCRCSAKRMSCSRDNT